jgi:hypothetical protein
VSEPHVDRAPELPKKTVSIRLDRRVYDNAVDIATAQGRSFNNWANRVIEYAIVSERLKSPTLSPTYPPHPEPPRTITRDIDPQPLTGDASKPFVSGVRLPEPDPPPRPRVQPGSLDLASIPNQTDNRVIPRAQVRPAKTEANPIPKKGTKR